MIIDQYFVLFISIFGTEKIFVILSAMIALVSHPCPPLTNRTCALVPAVPCAGGAVAPAVAFRRDPLANAPCAVMVPPANITAVLGLWLRSHRSAAADRSACMVAAPPRCGAEGQMGRRAQGGRGEEKGGDRRAKCRKYAIWEIINSWQ